MEKKGISIRGYDELLTDQEPDGLKKVIIFGDDNMEVSDGYHTIDELYDHRIELFIALCRGKAKMFSDKESSSIWRSMIHSDGTYIDDWFILGINKNKGDQITYHLPVKKWSETNFADTLDRAPEWDGHSSEDVVERLKKL